jgi:serine/threonine protein kinase
MHHALLADPLADADSVADPADDGLTLSGKYRLGSVLGRGGMGLVCEAAVLGRPERVAVKLLRRDHAHIEEARVRLLREAESLRRIDDPHVVRVLDVGETNDGRPFFVMELLDGVCFGTLAKRRSVSSAGEIAELIRQGSLGLAGAHRHGIIHRDIKPQNLMVTSDPQGAACVKLLDFGIASPREGDGESDQLRLTKTQVVMGTPVYMSPEQIRAPREADARCDVFSMGVVLYELLAGRLPWKASSPVDLVVRQYTEVPPRVDALRSDVPPGLAQVVARCLELEPSERFADGAALAAALAPFSTRVVAAPFLVDDDYLHTVVRDVYRPSGESDGPAPEARDLSSLFSEPGFAAAGAARLPAPEAPAPEAAPEGARRLPRMSRATFVAAVITALVLPPAVVVMVKIVAPRVAAHVSSAPAPRVVAPAR